MPLNAEPPVPSGQAPEPSSTDTLSSTSGATDGTEPTSQGAPVVEVVPYGGLRRVADDGSMRPLYVFLFAAALALVGTIVFALVHLNNARDLEEQLASAHADVVRVVDEGRTAQDGLAEQIAAAEKTLAGSKGKVVDDAVRADLAGHVEAARALDIEQAPAVPEPGAAGFAEVTDADALKARATEWATTMQATSTSLVESTGAVRTSYAQWRKERDAAQDKANAQAQQEKKTAAELKEATQKLSTVTPQLKISVRDSGYTLSWGADVGASDTVRAPLSKHRAAGEAALAATGDPKNLKSVTQLVERRETARAAIEAAAWDVRAAVADGSNGRLAQGDLCKVGVGPEGQDQYLRCDAAKAWAQLDKAFTAEFGKPLRVEYGYRPYDWQLQALDEFGSGQVAEPGTSNHGWAMAVDVPVDDGFRFGQPEFDWLAANGPKAGWHHPDWARAGGGREEPWHFEYAG